MSDHEFFDWAVARNLAYRIHDRMEPHARLDEQRGEKRIHLERGIALGDDYFFTKNKALCSFDVSTNWVDEIPIVVCAEKWVIRKPPEWHVSEDGTICFELGLNWSHTLTAMVEKYMHGLTAEYAASWLLNSTRSLLNRHLLAVRDGIRAWNPNWVYWPHGDAATKEFQRCLAAADRGSKLGNVG